MVGRGLVWKLEIPEGQFQLSFFRNSRENTDLWQSTKVKIVFFQNFVFYHNSLRWVKQWELTLSHIATVDILSSTLKKNECLDCIFTSILYTYTMILNTDLFLPCFWSVGITEERLRSTQMHLQATRQHTQPSSKSFNLKF